MTNSTIDIHVIRVFNLSFGNVYSIKFPMNVKPFSGLQFIANGDTWEVMGINTGNKDHNDNVWDCIISSAAGQSGNLPLGNYIIKLMNVKD